MVLNYERLKKERITKTEIKPYHMITAVTQRAVNIQLKKMYDVNESMRTLKINSADPKDDHSCLEGDLDPPTIELRLDQENRIVIFCFNFKRATLKYWDMDMGKKVIIPKETALPSGVLALSVNLSFDDINFKDLPKAVQKRLQGLGDYSVKQLLVDFTSASLARKDSHRTTIEEHMTEKEKANFKVFFEEYLSALAKTNNNILYYLPKANSEADRKQYPMPTIPPTDVNFQNLPFVTSVTDDGEASENNMLVYLQMTGNAPRPRELLGRPAANWVVPTPTNDGRYDGTVALSRDIFLDGWLLPQLAEFNRESTFVVTKAKFTVDFPKYWVYFEGGLGQYKATDEAVSFKSVDEYAVDKKVRELLNPQTLGRWYKYEDSNEDHDEGGTGYVKFEGKTKNYLFVPEGYNSDGKCEILLAGETRAWFRIAVDLGPGSDGLVVGTWNTSIILDGVNDGELSIKVKDIKPQFEETIDPAWFHKDETCAWVKTLRTEMDRLNMTNLVNQMRHVFGNGWDFVIPGAADFYIHRAVFNREQDLLCELKYKLQS